MKKIMLFGLLLLTTSIMRADTTSPSPIQTIANEFSMSFMSHVSAVDSFRQDGSHVIKFADGIIQAIPYKKDHLLVGSFGLIPHPEDSTAFFKSYSIHAHIFGFLSQFVDVNPTYASILTDFEITPGYSYDTDQRHGGFVFDIGYAHQFGSPQ